MNILINLSNYFSLLIPIMAFILLLSAFAFLLYLKKKADMFFMSQKSMANDIKRIADYFDMNNKNR